MEPFISEIRLFPYADVPEGWLPCDGRMMPIAQFQALYALLETTYGGDGRTTFALPDLRGRVPAGTGSNLPAGRAFAFLPGDSAAQPAMALNFCISYKGTFPSRP
jgi:microcystin-dependent protein